MKSNSDDPCGRTMKGTGYPAWDKVSIFGNSELLKIAAEHSFLESLGGLLHHPTRSNYWETSTPTWATTVRLEGRDWEEWPAGCEPEWFSVIGLLHEPQFVNNDWQL